MSKKYKYKNNALAVKSKPKRIIEKVSIDLGLKLMEQICNAPREDFQTTRFSKVTPTVYDTDAGILIHIDNGSKVLGVAHLDSYGEKYKHFDMVAGTRVYNASLDDRLGVYVLFHLAQMLNIDILLTEGEEIGNTTALHFEPDKKYNWIFEFDRGGKDVVLYEYEDDDTIDLIESYGFEVGMGSFSDISEMEHLGCKGFNIGTGYHDYHGKYAYANLHELKLNMRRFIQFIKDNQDTFLPHTETTKWDGYDFGYDYKYRGKSPRYDLNSYPYAATKDFNWDNYNDEEDEYEKSNLHLNSAWVCDCCGQSTPEVCLGVGDCEICGIQVHDEQIYFDFGQCEACYVATNFTKEEQKIYYMDRKDGEK